MLDFPRHFTPCGGGYVIHLSCAQPTGADLFLMGIPRTRTIPQDSGEVLKRSGTRTGPYPPRLDLPVQPPLAPMDALLVNDIPGGKGWLYEPKWDGFRCLVFRHGKELYLQSKSGQALTRYFPELAEAFLALKATRFVLDGEIAIPIAGRFSFDDLLQRIHPATTRVQKLSREHPALFIAFDLLLGPEGRALLNEPLRIRRPALEAFARKYFPPAGRLRLSPASIDMGLARQWFKATGGDLDGIIAKRQDLPYQSGQRAGMEKVKQVRTADCVIGGFRYASGSRVIGSLLLGLYNDSGQLDHVGFCSGLKTSERKALAGKLEPFIAPPGFTGHAPGGLSRWSTKRSMEWQPLKSKFVVEVSYDHFTGGRFRHGTRLVRWRPDKSPEQCRMDQVASSEGNTLALLGPHPAL